MNDIKESMRIARNDPTIARVPENYILNIEICEIRTMIKTK
jgi:hypothetical protein